MDRSTDGLIGGCTNRRIGWIDRWMSRRVDKWTEGQIDGWMNGKMDVCRGVNLFRSLGVVNPVAEIFVSSPFSRPKILTTFFFCGLLTKLSFLPKYSHFHLLHLHSYIVS